MANFSKFIRPESPRRGILTSGDLDALEIVLRYRFSPTSELVRLLGGNEDVAQRRLRKLWEWGLLNRFAFPFPRPHSEFVYYIDNRQTLQLLVQHSRLDEIHQQMWEEVRFNREANYATASITGQHMKLGFLQHGLMVSRLHFMLEMTGRGSEGHIELAAWRQGAELRGRKVDVPQVKSRRVDGSNEYVWEERDDTIRLPVEPDALFSLRLSGRPSDQRAHFCYEADRGSMPMADMLKKLRGYYHLVKRRQKNGEAFGVNPIRAVLIETTDEARARKLMELAQSSAVIGAGKRTALFWFIISPLLAAPTPRNGGGGHLASYLLRPEVIMDRLWAMPDLTLHSLGDPENSDIAQEHRKSVEGN